MKSPRAWAEDQPGTDGPANVRAYSPCDIRRVGPAFGGQPVPEPFPFETLGSVWPAMGVGPGPKVPTMPPFSYQGGKPSPAGKMSKVGRRIMGNSLLLMSLNFQREFYNFYAIALDVFRPPGSFLRYRNGYKRRERRSSLSYWLSKFFW